MGELRHKDVVTGKISEDEYENINQHILNGQATDDIVVATSAIQLGGLAVAASRIIGKKAAGDLAALTAAEVNTIIGFTRLESKVKAESRDMTAASGDVSYTGYGFLPSALITLSGVANTGTTFCWGFTSGLVEGRMHFYPDATELTVAGSYLVLAYETTAKYQIARVKSLDADGFTLTWTKGGVPAAGTLAIQVLALR